MIQKAIFNEDILQVFATWDEIQTYGIGRAAIKAMALAYLPPTVCDDATYVTADRDIEAAKLRYRQFCSRVWRRLQRLRHYDAVITANWSYWAERELTTALEQLGTPFLVLHKEGIKPPERSKLLRTMFVSTRGRFGGRRILVYQEDEREHQLAGGISRPDQIRIVGMPRLDRIHNWRLQAARGEVPVRATRPTLLFLAFLPNNFLPSYSGVASDLAWNELCCGSYKAVVDLARRRPEVDVLIRPRGYELPDVQRLLNYHAPLPTNLRVAVDGEVLPLIQASWVICGHNTTALLESVAAGKPVVVPRFAEAIDPRYSGYIVDVGQAAEYATSVDDLLARLDCHCSIPAEIPECLSQSAQAALAKWTGNADGRSSERVRAALLDEIRET